MKHFPWYAWIFVAVWAAWLESARGMWVEGSAHPTWVPDLGLVFWLALGARFDRAHLGFAAAAFALSRCAVSIETPIACVACAVGVTLFVRIARAGIEIGNPIPRTLLAFSCSLVVELWFVLVRAVRLDAQAAHSAAKSSIPFDLLGELSRVWPTAAATGLCALLAGGWIFRLPGLAPLWRRRAWQVSASSR